MYVCVCTHMHTHTHRCKRKIFKIVTRKSFWVGQRETKMLSLVVSKGGKGWKKRLEIFFLSTAWPHLTCNSYARPGPPPRWGTSECCTDVGKSRSRTDMASRLAVPSSSAFPYNLHHWLWNILGKKKRQSKLIFWQHLYSPPSLVDVLFVLFGWS